MGYSAVCVLGNWQGANVWPALSGSTRGVVK